MGSTTEEIEAGAEETHGEVLVLKTGIKAGEEGEVMEECRNREYGVIKKGIIVKV